MKILQSRSFQNSVKRFGKNEKKTLDEEIQIIANDPSVGVGKRGDLRSVFVHKFKIQSKKYLLSYREKDENLELIMLGPHENYYRDLKNYLKNQ